MHIGYRSLQTNFNHHTFSPSSFLSVSVCVSLWQKIFRVPPRDFAAAFKIVILEYPLPYLFYAQYDK